MADKIIEILIQCWADQEGVEVIYEEDKKDAD